jgi:hypothetical protein
MHASRLWCEEKTFLRWLLDDAARAEDVLESRVQKDGGGRNYNIWLIMYIWNVFICFGFQPHP